MNAAPAGRDASGLFRHGSMLVAGTLTGAVCNAAFHMVVGRERVLPNAEYGSLVAMLGIILVVSTPMLALQNTLAHFISTRDRAGRHEEILPFFLHWVVLFAGISAAIVTGAWFFREPLAAFWNVGPGLMFMTFAVLAASLWMSLFQGLLQGMQAFGWLAWAPQAWGVTRLVLGALLAIAVSATATAALAAQGIGVAVVLLLCTWALVRMHLTRGGAVERPPGSYRYLGSALLCLAGYAMLMNLDAALAKRYFDAETAGLFAKAATIARTAVFLPVPIATALFPKVSSAGELSPESWGLLGRALAFAGLLIGAAVAVCVVFPVLPWTILYGAWPPEAATSAAALTRAMVLAMAPLALAYLLLNFEMAQRHFRRSLLLVPAGLAYVAGVALFHAHPLHIPAVLGTLNLAVCLWLVRAVFRRRARG